jgi:hypothetical protein
MPLIGLPWALGLALLLAAAPASAQRTRSCAVAPFGALGIDESEAAKVQRWLESALATVPGHRFVAAGRLAKALQRQQRARRELACQADAACLSAALRSLGVELAVAGEVGSLGGGFMVYLRLVDAAGRSMRSVSGTLEEGAEGGLRAAARALAYQLLAPDRYHGRLMVRVDVAGAWIYLDGKRLARSPAAPLTGLAPGPHALRVTHEAYRDFVRFVTVAFDRTLEVPVDLSAHPVRGEELRLSLVDESRPLSDRELPWYRRWWAVAAFGAVILAGATATVAILSRRQVARDSEAVVRP